ncbi:MAG: hypothetical protein ABW148_15270 [Sedimenticola sp.]
MANKEGKAKFRKVSSGSIGKLAESADNTLVIAIGTYDAYAPNVKDVEQVLASDSLQRLLKETDKKVMVAIGTYDAFPSQSDKPNK